MHSELELQILGCLSYSHLFEYPLTEDEIRRRLISADFLKQLGFQTKKAADQDLKQALETLVIKKLIKEGSGFYLLSSAPSFWIKKRQRAQIIFAKKIKQTQSLADWLAKIPFVRAVALTGSIAAGGPEVDDDLDLFIVVCSGTLWLVRSVVLLRASFLNKRDEWCFNMWLSSTKLQLEKSRRNLYAAYEALQTLWVLDRDRYREKFFKDNGWTSEYLVSMGKPALLELAEVGQTPERSGAKLLGILCAGANWLLFIPQALYLLLKIKIPPSSLGPNRAILHGSAYAWKVMSRFKEQLKLAVESQR